MTVTSNKEQSGGKQNERNGRQGKKKKWHDNCKSWVYHSSNTLEKNKQNQPQRWKELRRSKTGVTAGIMVQEVPKV